MGRPSGSRGQDHEARKAQILRRMAQRLTEQDAMPASYRDLAAAAEVSLSTLQHYFGRRADIVAAVFEDARRRAAPHFAEVSRAQESFQDSIESLLAYMRLGFERFGVGELHALGFAEGVRNTALGPVVVEAILEPSIAAIAARLAEHQRRGQMRADSDPRHAAVMLIAPVVLMMLHQHELGGAARHAADMDRFFHDHAQAFVRGHAAAPNPPQGDLRS